MMLSLLGPLLIVTLAVAIIVFTLRVLVGPILSLLKITGVFSAPLRWGESWALGKSREALQTAERELQAKGKVAALKLFERAFFLDLIRFDSRLVDRAHEHNMAVLQAFLPLVREVPGSRTHMAAVEGLTQTRTQLLTRFFEARIAEAEIVSRRRAKGTPSWATGEFQKQRAQVMTLLLENKAELQVALSKLVASLVLPPRSGPDDVTVH